MAKKYKVTVRGVGRLNGNVSINKSVIYDDRAMAYKHTGASRNEVLAGFLNVHYPGVKVDPKNLSVNVIPIDDDSSKDSNHASKSTGEGHLSKFPEYIKNKYPKFSSGFIFVTNILLWLIAVSFTFLISSVSMGVSFVLGFALFLILWKYFGESTKSASEYFFNPDWNMLMKKLKWSNILGIVLTAVSFLISSYFF